MGDKPTDLQALLARIIAGEHAEQDLAALRQALATGQIALAAGGHLGDAFRAAQSISLD